MDKHDVNNQTAAQNGTVPPVPNSGIPTAPALPLQKTSDSYSGVKSNKYAGLFNQGSTCYLNALLQSLFMTPDFRYHLLNWTYDNTAHGSQADCIPYQLQKLFGRLQTKVRVAEETKGLTKSFGWNSGEVFQQHDIQELCRVLFEAIEMSLGPNDERFIQDLYQGNARQIIKCMECGHISDRDDKFLDLTVPILNIFEKIHNKSLEMALKNMLKPETLENENQYACEKCEKKVNALKYTVFAKLPNILFLQLGRFEYDYQTGMRKKIHDKIGFPLLLNGNKYMKDYSEIVYDPNESENDEFNLDFNEEKVKQYLNEGPLVYELFAIVVHSGSASGGHYYAYIKSFEDSKWYCFNDMSVTEIGLNDIKGMFGSDISAGASTSGYCLMYRAIYPNKKVYTINDFKFNEELSKVIEEENVKIIEEDRIKQERLITFAVKAYYNNVHKVIQCKKTDPVNELKKKILNEYELTDNVKPDDVRIRLFNTTTGAPLEYYNQEDTSLEANAFSSYKAYTLQFRDPTTGEFEEYDPSIVKLFIHPWIEENWGKPEEEFWKFEMIISNRETVGTLKKKICEVCKFHENVYMFKKCLFGLNTVTFNEIAKKDEELNNSLVISAILDHSQIYLEEKNDEPFHSMFMAIFDEKYSQIKVLYNKPLDYSKRSKDSILSTDYLCNEEIFVKKTDTLRKVKDMICRKLNVEPEGIIMKLFSHKGKEIRNLKETVDNLTKGVSASLTIFIEPGLPMRDEELTVNVLLCENSFTVYNIYPYKLFEVGEMIINENLKFKDLKPMFAKLVKDKKGIDIDVEYSLIREQISGKPAKIFPDEQIVKELDFPDGKKLIIQEYKPEKLVINPNNLQVATRFFDIENWIMSEPYELQVSPKETLLDLALEIHKHFPYVIPENMVVYKIGNGHSIYLDDLSKCSFEDLYENASAVIDRYPLYLRLDGYMIIVRDKTQQMKEPAEEVKAYSFRPIIPDEQPSQGSKNAQGRVKDMVHLFEKGEFDPVTHTKRTGDPSVKVHFKEKGIVITVKRNQVEESEKKEEEPVKVPEEKDVAPQEEIKHQPQPKPKPQPQSQTIPKIDDSDDFYMEPLI